MSYERDAIKKMSGYQPGKQPKKAGVVKLNTNENPYPPAPAVIEALRAIGPDDLRRYPPPLAEVVRDAAANLHGLGSENVVAVNGGDELLRMAVTTFVEPGRAIGMIDPSYSLYPVLAEINGSPVVQAPADDDWSMPADLAERMNQAGVQLTFVANPHAPSGRLTPAAEIMQLAGRLQGVLLVDEAYVNFVDPEKRHDLIPLVSQLDNLLLLRTLSKGYSLAGLRFGYGLGSVSLIEPLLTKTRDSYNVDAVAQRLAAAALQSQADAQATWRKVREQRAWLRRELNALGLPTPESQSNFLLATVTGRALSARDVYRKLEESGVYVRYFEHERLRDKLRITVGAPEQNQRLIEELMRILV